MDNRFTDGARRAREDADERTAGEQGELSLPTWDQLRELLPDPMDQQELDDLIAIVQADTTHNEKVASLIANINGVASVVVKALGKLP